VTAAQLHLFFKNILQNKIKTRKISAIHAIEQNKHLFVSSSAIKIYSENYDIIANIIGYPAALLNRYTLKNVTLEKGCMDSRKNFEFLFYFAGNVIPER